MKWPIVKLGDVAEFIRNGASIKQGSSSQGLRITRIETISTGEVNLEKCGYANIQENEYPNYRLKKGDILISHINSVSHLGKCAIFKEDRHDIVHGMNLLLLRPSGTVFPMYLYYVISSKEFLTQISKITKKSVNQASFTVPNYKGLQIPLPPPEEQERIAAILDKVDCIRRKRQESLRQADEFIKSVFLDMFGDPVTNPKGWAKEPLRNVCDIITGNTPPRADASNYGDYIEWIKSDNINTPFTYLTKATEYISEKGYKKCRHVDSGAILMTCIAGSINCIGNVAIADRKVAFNQQINAILPNDNSSMFIYWQILLSQKSIQASINKSLKGILNKSQLGNLNFIFPPPPLQNNFTVIAEHIEHSKKRALLELTETETLFKALQQEFFE